MVMSGATALTHISVDIWFWDEAELGEPRNLRFLLGAEAGGAYPVTVEWDAPASWGDDRLGTQDRAYSFQYRQITNGDGTPHTGTYQAWRGVPRSEAQRSHVNPNAPEGSIWESRVRAINKLGEHSGYAQITYHPTSGLFGFRFGPRFD